jgi:hypothetical protein
VVSSDSIGPLALQTPKNTVVMTPRPSPKSQYDELLAGYGDDISPLSGSDHKTEMQWARSMGKEIISDVSACPLEKVAAPRAPQPAVAMKKPARMKKPAKSAADAGGREIS